VLHSPLLGIAVLTLLIGCESGIESSAALDVVTGISSHIPTVATVRWSAGEGVLYSYVEYGPDESLGSSVPAANGGDGSYEAMVLGLKPDTAYHLRAVSETASETLFSDVERVTTGSVPADLCTLALDADHHDPDRADEGFLLTTTIPGRATIIDSDGDRVWWHGVSLGDHNHTTRAHLAADGVSMLYLTWVSFSSGGAYDDIRHLIRVRLDGSEVELIPAPMAHHDFEELPDGTLTTLQYHELPIEQEGIYGDRLVELHADGSEVEIWRLWDAWTFSLEDVHEEGRRWGHSNAVDYEPSEDAYYVSALYFDTIFKIDRATGDVIWRLGGPNSDFELTTGDEGWFDGQHQFQLTDGGIIVFDNGPNALTETRIAEYLLDEDAMTAELVWSYQPDPPLGIYALGDVARLESGNTLSIWSMAGRTEQIAPEGDGVWRLEPELGASFGYGSGADSLYPKE